MINSNFLKLIAGLFWDQKNGVGVRCPTILHQVFLIFATNKNKNLLGFLKKEKV